MNKDYYWASRYLYMIRGTRKKFWSMQTDKTPAIVELTEQMQGKLIEMENFCRDCMAKSVSDFKL